MSRRGRRSDSPISLFSFQDIITSVTAIMILLVLILTLELITRMNHKGVAADDRRVVEELTQSIDAMRERCAELEQQTADAQKTAQRIASQSVRQVEADKRREQRRSESLRQELAALAAQARQAKEARQAAERELVKAEKTASSVRDTAERASRDAATATELEDQNERESVRQDIARKDLGDRPTSVAKLVFNPPVGEQLKPVLIEVSDGGIAVMNDDGSGVQDFGWGLGAPPAGFSQWLRQRDKSREYVVIMLRASGVDRLDATRRAISDAGLELGVELVGDDMDIVMRSS